MESVLHLVRHKKQLGHNSILSVLCRQQTASVWHSLWGDSSPPHVDTALLTLLAHCTSARNFYSVGNTKMKTCFLTSTEMTHVFFSHSRTSMFESPKTIIVRELYGPFWSDTTVIKAWRQNYMTSMSYYCLFCAFSHITRWSHNILLKMLWFNHVGKYCDYIHYITLLVH